MYNKFKIISKFITGSNLYGTNTKESDIDIRGVFIPTKEYFLGFLNNIKQFTIDKTIESDSEYTEIRQFIALAANCNPNIIEYLFVPQDKYSICTKEWQLLVENRYYFLSKKARYTFTGYAMSQLHRIKNHRSWLLSPPKKKPERSEFGLPEKRLITNDQLGAFNVVLCRYLNELSEQHELKDQIEQLLEYKDFLGIIQGNPLIFDSDVLKHILPVSDNFLEILDKEKRYTQAINHYKQYNEWKQNRNPKRAILEEKYGYDCKHASQLVRLLSEGEELLMNHCITFPRPDSKFLLEVKNGIFTYDQLIEYIGDIDTKFDEFYKSTTLPHTPNKQKLDELCINIVEQYLMENY